VGNGERILTLVLYKKNIFLLDGIGALISTLLLGLVLPYFQNLIGMPKQVLYLLAAIPFIFSIYSLSCFWFHASDTVGFLTGIVLGNSLYCLLTTALIIYHFNKLTLLGLSYFIIENIIVIILISIEYRVLKSGEFNI
jgi:hypothetical protein